MNGQWLGSRGIRVNWANQKTQTGGAGSRLGGMPPMPPQGFGQNASPMAMSHSPVPHSYTPPIAQPMAYDASALGQPGSETNCTVYVGNLIPYTTQADLIPLFQGLGYIVEIRMQADRGFAFVKLDSHQNAANAIAQLQNRLVHGRPIKSSWGKDKEGGAGHAQQPYQVSVKSRLAK